MLEIMNGTMLNILKVERRNEEKKMPLRLVWCTFEYSIDK
jgi:tRNA U34 5-methylaminomethyl-2-thiouridine-forming methyltransferase MnmC